MRLWFLLKVMPSTGTFQTSHCPELWHNLAACWGDLAYTFPEKGSKRGSGFDWRLTSINTTNSEIILRESCKVLSFVVSISYTVIRGSDLFPAFSFHFINHMIDISSYAYGWCIDIAVCAPAMLTSLFLRHAVFFFASRFLPVLPST